MELVLAALAALFVYFVHREGIKQGEKKAGDKVEEARGEVADEKRNARHAASLSDKLRGIYERFANRG